MKILSLDILVAGKPLTWNELGPRCVTYCKPPPMLKPNKFPGFGKFFFYIIAKGQNAPFVEIWLSSQEMPFLDLKKTWYSM